MTDTPASLLGFEYQALIDDITKKSIGFQTTIGKDCSQIELDSLLDKCRLAVTRQKIFAEIEAKTIDFRNLEENLDSAHRALYEEDKRFADRAENHDGRAARGLSTAEQKARQDKLVNLANGAAMRDSIRAKLEILRAMVHEPEVHLPQKNDEQGRWADNGGAALSS